MKVSNNILGGIIILIAVLTSFRWYYAHILKGMLVPELAVSVFALYIIGALIVTGKLKIK